MKRILVFLFLAALPLAAQAAGPLRAATVPQFAMHEVALTASATFANPYTEVSAECVLTEPDGRTTRSLPLFWLILLNTP